MDKQKSTAWFMGIPVTKGSSTSGNFAHRGRPKKRGGSAPGGGHGGIGIAAGATPDERKAAVEAFRDEAKELAEVEEKLPFGREMGWTGQITELPTSSGQKPRGDEIGLEGVLGTYTLPLSTREFAGSLMRGKDGNIYATRPGGGIAEVRPTQMSSKGKVPWYGSIGDPMGKSFKPRWRDEPVKMQADRLLRDINMIGGLKSTSRGGRWLATAPKEVLQAALQGAKGKRVRDAINARLKG